MADSIFDFDSVAANNTSYAGIPYGPNQLYHNQIDNLFRAYAGALGGFVDDLGAVATPTGSATAVAVTLSQGFTGYGTASGEIRHGTLIALKMPWAATAAATLAINAIAGTKKIRRQGDAAIEANDWIANGIYFFRYDTAYDSANGAWVLMNPASSGITFASNATAVAGTSTVLAVNPANLLATRQLLNGVPFNLGLAATVGSSALTISLKGADGNDPSATNPVEVPFRNVTATTGTPTVISVTAATSLVISSGSTMGFTSGSIGRLWIVGFNDGGTFRLGAVNCLSGTNIMALRPGIYSSTAEGASGGADSAQTIYTGTAVTSKAMTILGYLEATEATAGTWATAPSLIKVFQPGDPLPGESVSGQYRDTTGAMTTTTSAILADNSKPQSSEGAQALITPSLTPTSAANVLRAYANFFVGADGTRVVVGAMFRDSAADAVAATTATTFNSASAVPIVLDYAVKAGSTSATQFKARFGTGSGGTVYLNGLNGTQAFDGVANSVLYVEEIMA